MILDIQLTWNDIRAAFDRLKWFDMQRDKDVDMLCLAVDVLASCKDSVREVGKKSCRLHAPKVSERPLMILETLGVLFDLLNQEKVAEQLLGCMDKILSSSEDSEDFVFLLAAAVQSIHQEIYDRVFGSLSKRLDGNNIAERLSDLRLKSLILNLTDFDDTELDIKERSQIAVLIYVYNLNDKPKSISQFIQSINHFDKVLRTSIIEVLIASAAIGDDKLIQKTMLLASSDHDINKMRAIKASLLMYQNIERIEEIQLLSFSLISEGVWDLALCSLVHRQDTIALIQMIQSLLLKNDLFKLCCCLIRNGTNAIHFFRLLLIPLLNTISEWGSPILCDVVIGFCCIGARKDLKMMSLCFPSLLKIVKLCSFVEESQRVCLFKDIVEFAQSAIESHLDVSVFFSHGVELLFAVCDSAIDLRQLLPRIRRLITLNQHPVLLIASNALDFVQSNEIEVDSIRMIFALLLSTGKRDKLGEFAKIWRHPIDKDMFQFIPKAFADITSAFSESKRKSCRKRSLLLVSSISTVSAQLLKLNKVLNKPHIFEFIVEEFADILLNASSQSVSAYAKKLQQLSLVSSLFSLDGVSDPKMLWKSTESKFPSAIVEDPELLCSFLTIVQRLDNLKPEKFTELESLTVKTLRSFVDGFNGDSLECSFAAIEDIKCHLQFNIDQIRILLGVGYHCENFKSTGSDYSPSNFNEFKQKWRHQEVLTFVCLECVNRLSSLDSNTNNWDIVSISTDEQIEDLIEKKNALQKKLNEFPKANMSRIWSLLKEMDQEISTEAQNLKMEWKKRSLFSVLDIFNDVGSNCYAPKGSHNEKPFEIFFRADHTVWTIKQDQNMIQNAEVLFTLNGALVYRAFPANETEEISLFWIHFFCWMIQEEIVPKILLPMDHPTTCAYKLLERWISLSAAVPVEFTADWMDSFATYHDRPPEKIYPGHGLVLTRENTRKLGLFCGFGSQTASSSMVNGDCALGLGDHVHSNAMQGFTIGAGRCRDVLGKSVRLYLQHLMQFGAADANILIESFDQSLWETQFPLIKGKHEIKEYVKSKILESVEGTIDSLDIDHLFDSNPQMLFDLKSFLSKYSPRKNDKVVKVLLSHVELKSIRSLSPEEQISVIKWIYRNEDRVWRFRGGRPSNEMLSDFLRFIDPSNIPGWIAISQARKPHSKLDAIIGYVAGEIVDDRGKYEIVAAWTHDSFRNMGIAGKLYSCLLDELYKRNLKYIRFDVVSSSFESITDKIAWRGALGMVKRIGLLPYFIESNEDSYMISNVIDTQKEQFERYDLYIPLCTVLLRISQRRSFWSMFLLVDVLVLLKQLLWRVLSRVFRFLQKWIQLNL